MGNRNAKNLPAKGENLEQRALFEEYCKMGAKRTLKKLLDISPRSWKTIQSWSIRFQWVRRAEQKDRELMECVGLESPKQNIERKQLILDIINHMIEQIAVLDENGKVKETKFGAKNVYDIRTLVDIRDEVLGVKKDAKESKSGNTNIDKAIFIIKK